MIAGRQDTELTQEVVTFTEARLSDGVLGVQGGVPGHHAPNDRRGIRLHSTPTYGLRVSASRTWNACAAHCWPDSLTPDSTSPA